MAKVIQKGKPSKPRVKVEAIKLPTTTISNTPKNAQRYSSSIGIIYGPRKIGKTWLACSFPQSLILDLEGNDEFLQDHPNKNGLYLQPISTINELRGAVKTLLIEDLPYKTIILDTITTLNHWIEKEVERELEIVFGSAGFARDYASARSKIMDIIDTLRKVKGKRIILLGHSSVGSEETNFISLELTGKVKALVASLADWMGYMRWDDNTRVLTFPTSNEVEGGSRYPQLVGQSIPATYEAFADKIGENINESTEDKQ